MEQCWLRAQNPDPITGAMMATTRPAADLQAIKNALQRYERTRRARLPAGRDQMNLEMADLLLTLLRLADRLDVDLLNSAETLLEQRLPRAPKLVSR